MQVRARFPLSVRRVTSVNAGIPETRQFWVVKGLYPKGGEKRFIITSFLK